MEKQKDESFKLSSLEELLNRFSGPEVSEERITKLQNPLKLFKLDHQGILKETLSGLKDYYPYKNVDLQEFFDQEETGSYLPIL